MTYPPYTITSAILKHVANIGEQLAARAALGGLAVDLLSPHLRRGNRIRTIHASLAIENNTLSLEQVTDIINGKTVIGPPRDIQEVHGAVSAYERLDTWQPHKLEDLLSAHAVLMHNLVERPGSLRTGGVGVFQGNRVVHILSFARFYTNNGSDHSACFRLPTPFGDSFGGIAWGTFLRHG